MTDEEFVLYIMHYIEELELIYGWFSIPENKLAAKKALYGDEDSIFFNAAVDLYLKNLDEEEKERRIKNTQPIGILNV